MKKLFLVALSMSITYFSKAQFWDISEPIKLEGTVNTEAEESIPIFSKDTSIIYFTRTFDATNKGGMYDQDIWMATKEKSGVYTNCQRIKSLNNKYHNSIFGINYIGNTLYLVDSYEGKKDLKKGVAISRKKGEEWLEPEHVSIPTLDIDGESYGFYVDGYENVILISYTGPGTVGQEDLFVSKKENGIWTIPVHMGNVINTAQKEISPFLSKNLDTLYYSSNGLGGEGDMDIFYSVRLDDTWTNWSTPVNLGNKINTPKFDAYFRIMGNEIYWCSNKETELSEIYHASILAPPPLFASAVGTDVSIYNGRDGSIDLTPEGGIAPYTYEWSNGADVEDPTGLVKGQYTVLVTDAIGQTAQVVTTIKEPPMEVGQDIAQLLFPPVIIYFDLNKHNIRPDAESELQRVIDLLNEHPEISIELGSHTDCRSSMAYNMRLSSRRATSTREYIQARIENPDRVTGKGYGESRLKVDCPCEGPVKSSCSEEEHQLNRRTEFVITSIDERYKKAIDLLNQGVEQVELDLTKPESNEASVESINRNQTISESQGTIVNVKEESAPVIVEKTSENGPKLTESQKHNIKLGYYIVEAGETLYRISKNTGVSVDDLKSINKLESNTVYPGLKLLLK
jgi:OmpA-OmpF porin, OOP family